MDKIKYKIMGVGGKSYYGGAGAWSLPHGDQPGEWMPPISDIKLCERGYHYLMRSQVVEWLGPEIYEVEVRGETKIGDDKSVASEARLIRRLYAGTWTEHTARLFAVDCAQTVLSNLKQLYDDPTPRFANGTIDLAARAAAYLAARAVAHKVESAAYVIARWTAYWTAESATDLAPGADADAATWRAARLAAFLAARATQTELLFEYLEGRRR